ncbi:lysosome membrane protein 2-like isoform X2 [Biomphalaria glabrata]|nr:lysosome membrane protein 2-like isoform X2 [Biomphalaria glabrata]XP_055891428.1 lysosome membrane protein 2-like isoform X2 [Biomphalaria glabrata]
MSRKKIIVIFIVGILFAAIGGALFPLIDYFIQEEIKKKMVISNTSETYDIWQDVPVPVYMQFYVFDLDNPEEVKNGDKPSLIQRGPYTYRERRTKFDIVWNDNGTVTYKQNRTFHFVQEMSSGTETDMITTVNPIVAVIAHSFKWMPSLVKTIVSEVLGLDGENLFMTRPVEEVLWGYDDPSLVLLNKMIPAWFQTTFIGYFMRRNYTDDGLYTVHTGETDIGLVGIISRYNGDSAVNVWSTPWANMVNGTDGTLSPPLDLDRHVAQIFVSDVCRSIRGVFKEEVTLPQGIDLRRYGGDKNDMLNASANKDNIGFCIPQTDCLPTGLLNSTTCQEPVDGFPLPIIVSFPHFLYADPDVINSFIGLQPNEDEHQTLIDIEPWTGLVLQAAKRLQINIFIEQVPYIKQTDGIRKLYFPVFWLNESSVTDDEHANLLKSELFTPMMIADIVKYSLLALGGFFVLLAVALLIHNKCKHESKSESVTQSRENHSAREDDTTAPFLKSRSVTYDDPLPGSSTLGNSYQQVSTSSSQGIPHDSVGGFQDEQRNLLPSDTEQTSVSTSSSQGIPHDSVGGFQDEQRNVLPSDTEQTSVRTGDTQVAQGNNLHAENEPNRT